MIAAALREAAFVRATGAGTGGIAMLILDGEHVAELLATVFQSRKSPVSIVPGEIVLGRIIDRSEQIVDEVLVAPISEKDSETGNLQFELSCHGGAGALIAVEDVLQAAGFARGAPTLLLERAHLVGRLSLVAIEARLRLAGAMTTRQADLLLHYKDLQQHWERLGLDAGLKMRSSDSAWREAMHSEADKALRHGRAAFALLGTHHIAVLGPTNAGKSALVAAIARADVHLVSDIAGTTLDRLDTHLDIRGLDCIVSDTAGLRETSDEIEREGQRRALDAAKCADLRLLVFDASVVPADADLEFLKSIAASGRRIVVLNKHDLGQNENATGLGFVAGAEAVATAATTGFGLAALESAIERELLGADVPTGAAPFTQRQLRHIEDIAASLKEGQIGIDVLNHVRKLVGTRPDIVELQTVFAEARECLDKPIQKIS